MVISLKRLRLPVTALVTAAAILVSILALNNGADRYSAGYRMCAGGNIHSLAGPEPGGSRYVSAGSEAGADPERFQRPAKQKALKLKYSAKDFIGNHGQQQSAAGNVFQTPEDVIQAYYAILRDASNMAGYYGGCGTVGWSDIPYPYAYRLLAPETARKISMEEFIKSFEGIGHITLLKLYPAYKPVGTSSALDYQFVEIETITGPKYEDNGDKGPKPGYFAYYYGLVTAEKIHAAGWKIKAIDYIPEDFLCHPMHHWDYDARFLTGTVYGSWYGLISGLEAVVQEDPLVRVYAAGEGKRYRFDFVRLTNGDDVLLHEYTQQDGQWKEVSLLKKEHQLYKLSVLNPSLISR